MRRSLLVAGFGAFPGHRRNPAEFCARWLEKKKSAFALAGIDLRVAVLPVEFSSLSPVLSQLFAGARPDAVVLLGVAGRRRRLTIETLARNRVSTLRPDAARQQAFSRFIVHGGPESFRAGCSPPRLAAIARRAGLPASLSRDAGDFLCNESFYLSLLMGRRACFLHLPDWRGARLERAAHVIARIAGSFATG